RLSSRGFTPNGEYRTQAWYPDGTPYTHLFDGGKGRADATGSTPNWTWDCKDGANNRPDPNGIYIIKMTDVTTGHWVMARMEVKL
ncbi:MAG TPA: hypothetical protein VFB59_03260, partial [Candidatus Saccharimonadales bacterium]|nr:hypothetical protein [Candidatus Saccharimonadales bacterium]